MTDPSPVVIWRQAPRWEREKLIAELRAALLGRVEEAWLFGSYAAGTAHADSDVDLIVVCATSRAWPDRAEDFADLFARFGSVDLLVYTPAEWEKLRAAPSSLLRHASQTWKRLC